MRNAGIPPLHLRVGDLVEVRTEQEILETLDERGTVDGMPFMPEMLEFCGRRFRVEKRADKACNTITVMESRRLYDVVHLESLRCNGSAHGGCQAQCLLYWKEAWLCPVNADGSLRPTTPKVSGHSQLKFDRSRLSEATRRPESSRDTNIAYRCQATDLLNASESLRWWDVRQYFRDVWSGNTRIRELVKVALFRIFQKTIRITAYSAQIRAYNTFQSWRGGSPYPYQWGNLSKTPHETLGLQPGDLVQVKSYEEILATLNTKNKNLGLRFDAEMVPYCGSLRRVRARVERIIDERTGEMITFPRDCIILDGVICRGQYSKQRLFCPRSIYPYWREIWLKRAEDTSASPAKSGTDVLPSDGCAHQFQIKRKL
jgi:hypothetical protein